MPRLCSYAHVRFTRTELWPDRLWRQRNQQRVSYLAVPTYWIPCIQICVPLPAQAEEGVTAALKNSASIARTRGLFFHSSAMHASARTASRRHARRPVACARYIMPANSCWKSSSVGAPPLAGPLLPDRAADAKDCFFACNASMRSSTLPCTMSR